MAGCGEDAGAEASPSPTVTVTDTLTATVTATPEPSASESEEPSQEPDNDPSTEDFGEAISFENGLSISISRPKRFTPSSDANYDGYPLPKQGVPVMFTIKIENEGTRTLSRDLEFVDVSSAGRPSHDVGLNDPKYSLQALPIDTPLPAGQKSVYEMGYFVQDPDDVTVTYTPNNAEPVNFTTSE